MTLYFQNTFFKTLNYLLFYLNRLTQIFEIFKLAFFNLFLTYK